MSSKSLSSSLIPAALAIAGRCNTRLVEPPVAMRPTIPFTKAFSSKILYAGVKFFPKLVISSARFVANSVNAVRKGVLGGTNEAPGKCNPINSISI